MTGPIIPAGDFRGDNAKLIACIGALLSMDADGALVPHGIGGHARSLLAAAAARIPTEPTLAIDLEQFIALANYSQAQRLLALIDGQARSGDDSQRLEWLMRNISGAELRRLNVWTDASCDRAAIDKAMKPSKGEGE